MSTSVLFANVLPINSGEATTSMSNTRFRFTTTNSNLMNAKWIPDEIPRCDGFYISDISHRGGIAYPVMVAENTNIFTFVVRATRMLGQLPLQFYPSELIVLDADQDSTEIKESSDVFLNLDLFRTRTEHILDTYPYNNIKPNDISRDVKVLKDEMVSALCKIWTHIGSDRIKRLMSLPIGDIENIYKMFVLKSSVVIEVPGEGLILDEIIPELFVYEIGSSALIFTANAVYQQENNLFKKKVTPPVDDSYALIVDNYASFNDKEFEEYIEKKLWDKIHSEMGEFVNL